MAINYLNQKLRNWKGINILDREFLHMRCAAHIVNLIVTSGLKEIHDTIVGIRNVFRYIKLSPSRLQKFKACVEKEKIDHKDLVALDVPTRWNSIYLMLESGLKFQNDFDRMEEDDENYLGYFAKDEHGRKKVGPPLFIDWENARVFVKFLEIFYDVTIEV